ncbi:MAG: TolC family protein [Proteobacteria bacterium]|nr:TolC family protein [Pseudomonadota bacterium]
MRLISALAAAAFLSAAVPAGADDSTLQQDLEAIEAMSTLGDDARGLPLEQAVRQTLEENLGLRVRVKELEAAQSRLKASWAPWMPFVTGGWNYHPSRNERFVEDYATWRRANEDGASYDVGVGVNLPTGTNLTLTWAQGQGNSKVTYDPEVYFDNPLDPDAPIPFLVNRDFSTRWSSLSIQLNQSLLEGISPVYQLRGVRKAGLLLDAAAVQRDQEMTDAVALVLNQYWDLVGYRRLVEIHRIDRRLAESQREVTQALIDAGKLAPIELLRIDERVASASASVLEAEHSAANAERGLKQLMRVDADHELHRVPLRPTDGVTSVIPLRDLDASLQMAVVRNPGLQLARNDVENDRIDLQAAKHEMLPDLSLNAGLSLNGSGFQLRESIQDVAGARFPDLQVGMTFTMPVPDVGAIYQLRAADLEYEAAQAGQANIELQLLSNVEGYWFAVQSFQAQVEVAQVRVSLAAQTAEASAATYEAGKNTLRDVFEAQADLKEARTALLQAQIAELKSRVELEVLRGSLLETLGVEIE